MASGRAKIPAGALVVGGYVGLEWLLLATGALASDWSYAVWATAGVLSALMMMLGGLIGFAVLFSGILERDQTTILCGATLVGGCGLPVVAVLVGGGLLGF